jgi:hypothetical protein
MLFVLDDLNQEKYRAGEAELRSEQRRRRRPLNQFAHIKDWVRRLKRRLGPKPSRWD